MDTERSRRISCRLPPSVAAVGMAYRCLGGLRGVVADRELEDLRLLVSELVTNSVRHAGLGPGDGILVWVEVSEGGVRAEVSNPGMGFEVRPVQPGPDQTSGWGLYLVDQVSSSWGVSKEVGGEVSTGVWFFLAAG